MPDWTETHQNVLKQLVQDYQTVGAIFTALGNARELQISSSTDEIVSESYNLIITWLGWKNQPNVVINQRETIFINKAQALIS